MLVKMSKFKILLVDDDVEDRAIVQYAMDLNEAEDILFFADNGEQALTILDKYFAEEIIPCLIVLDLNMPCMNGTQTLEQLKKDSRFQNIPVIIYSTSINPMEKEKCMLLGAHDYITKPISFKESMQTAKTFLQYCSGPTVKNR